MKNYEIELVEKLNNASSIAEATEQVLKYFQGRDIPFVREFVEKLLELTYTGIIKIVENQTERFDIQERFKGLVVLQKDNQRLYILEEPLTNNDWIQVDVGDKFPSFVGNANKFLRVNSTATSLSFVTIDQINNEIRQRNKFEYNQLVPAAIWNITHNLQTYPSVTVVDSAGTVVFGLVEYIDQNKVKVTFKSPFSGKAYLN